jgi:hypothetical protein
MRTAVSDSVTAIFGPGARRAGRAAEGFREDLGILVPGGEEAERESVYTPELEAVQDAIKDW